MIIDIEMRASYGADTSIKVVTSPSIYGYAFSDPRSYFRTKDMLDSFAETISAKLIEKDN